MGPDASPRPSSEHASSASGLFANVLSLGKGFPVGGFGGLVFILKAVAGLPVVGIVAKG